MRLSLSAGAVPLDGRLRWITLSLLLALANTQAEALPSSPQDPSLDPSVHPLLSPLRNSLADQHPGMLPDYVSDSHRDPAVHMQAPPNDNLADAIAVDMLPFVDHQDATQATSEPGELTSSCADGEVEDGVWYRLRLAQATAVVIDTIGSGDGDIDTDTVLSVWTGSGHPLTEVACNDDIDDADDSEWSRIELAAGADTTYMVKAASWSDWKGPITVRIKVQPPPPANDDISSAQIVDLDRLPYTDRRDTSTATDEPGEVISQCNEAESDSAVWYRLEATVPTSVILTTEGSTVDGETMDTVLSAWTGGAEHPLTEIECNDDASDSHLWSRLELELDNGSQVYVKVGGFEGSRGMVAFNADSASPPANGVLSRAVTIDSLPFVDSRSTSGAHDETDERRASCAHAEGPERAVWFRYVADADAEIVFSTASSTYSTVLSAWQGAPIHPLVEAACAAEEPLVLSVTAGETYFVKAGGMFGATGWLEFAADMGSRPTNDNLADAMVVRTLPFSDTVSVALAGDEPGEARASCAIADQIERAVWYRYQPTEDHYVLLEASGAATVLSVWSGGPEHPLAEARCVSPSTSPGGVSRIELQVISDETYYFKMGPYAGAPSRLTISARVARGRPANDDVIDAVGMSALPFRDSLDSERATDEADEMPSGCTVDVPGVTERGVWYRVTPSSDGHIRLSTEGSDYDTVLSVWAAPPRHPMTELDCNDDAGGKWSALDVDVESGTTYFVKAGGQAGNAGHLVVSAEAVDVSADAGVFLPLLARNAPIQ